MDIKYAPSVWNLLNGVLCVYKPAGETINRVRRSLLTKLCNELNLLECRPPRPYETVEIGENGEKSLVTRPSFADNPLVVGPRYQSVDFKCICATYLGENTSGVYVLGLNNGTNMAFKINHSYPMRTYHIKGKLGFLTNNLFKTGKVVEESSYKHVKRNTVDKILASVQASHQRSMFQLCGVDIQSQEAFELAAKGLIRPTTNKTPVIYGIKCVEFNPPDFTIEVNCINEYEAYLMALIQNLGLQLHSSATCMGLLCVKHSYFTLDHALLKKHWSLQHVIHNLATNKRLFRSHGKLTQQIKEYKSEHNSVGQMNR